MAEQPWMIIIAGPNGAGKSTFYEDILKSDPLFKKAEFINLDVLAAQMAGKGRDPNDFMFSAGKIISNRLQERIEKKRSFIYETTSSGRTHLKVMEEAKKRNFKIATIFIGLSKVEISHLRVQQRVREGGHDVPPEDIDRRYAKVIKNFPDMLKYSDVSAVFDNSGKHPFKLIFLMDERQFFIFHKYPRWLENSMKERKTSKDMFHITNRKLKGLPPEQTTQIIKNVFAQLSR